MKVACIDKTAADRIALQRFMQDSFERCRDAVGHVSLLQPYLCSVEEVQFDTTSEVLVIGPRFSLAELLELLSFLKKANQTIPIVIILALSSYSLRTLRTLQRSGAEVFSLEEQPVRLVHYLCTIVPQARRSREGKVVVLNGAKGGSGTTSLTAGLAHATLAKGKRAVILDLSATSALYIYMRTGRSHSPDWAAALIDRLQPDRKLVERSLATAPNGLDVLLPPGTSVEVRDLWLRDGATIEITLGVFDILRDLYDFIFVDCASSEGILPFALNSHADYRLLVSSDDPASIHLLGSAYFQIADIPGPGQVHILFNRITQSGLTEEDALHYLRRQGSVEVKGSISSVPFDLAAGSWIGTGNSFYTEGSSFLQNQLERYIEAFTLSSPVIGEYVRTERPMGSVHRILSRLLGQQERKRIEYIPNAKGSLPEINIEKGLTSTDGVPSEIPFVYDRQPLTALFSPIE